MEIYEAIKIIRNAIEKHYNGKQVMWSFFEAEHLEKGKWVAVFGTNGNPNSKDYDVNEIIVDPSTKAVEIKKIEA